MSNNQVFASSDRLSLEVGTGVKAGEPVRVGCINGVAETDSGDLVGTAGRSNVSTSNASAFASVCSVGVYKLDVQSTAAAAKGDPVYIKSDRTLTTTATSNKLWGVLTRPIGAGTSKALVAVIQFSV